MVLTLVKSKKNVTKNQLRLVRLARKTSKGGGSCGCGGDCGCGGGGTH
ncbi:MAG TPA: hypothetical protein VIH57_20295 [Bacteroidales bacterium]|jgi:hypothetical protein